MVGTATDERSRSRAARRILVVHQWVAPGAPHDQQRGSMYAPLFRAAGMDARYVGRHPIPPFERRLGRSRWAFVRAIARSAPYRLAYRLMDLAVTAVNDRRIVALARRGDDVLLIKIDSLGLIRRLRRRGSRLIYDLADAKRADAAPTSSLSKILASVDVVTADNTLGVEFAARYHPSVHLWPTTSYVERFDEYRASSRRGRDGKVVLGWVGSETTVSNLFLIVESLESLFRERTDLELRLLGVPQDHPLLRSFERVRASTLPAYDTDEMLREVVNMDIGLFPMYDVEDMAMHGITKALIYMGAGCALIASPVGDCRSLVREGVNGMLASTPAEWTAKLHVLVNDPALRARLARGALTTAREEYSLEQCFSSVRRAIEV